MALDCKTDQHANKLNEEENSLLDATICTTHGIDCKALGKFVPYEGWEEDYIIESIEGLDLRDVVMVYCWERDSFVPVPIAKSCYDLQKQAELDFPKKALELYTRMWGTNKHQADRLSWSSFGSSVYTYPFALEPRGM